MCPVNLYAQTAAATSAHLYRFQNRKGITTSEESDGSKIGSKIFDGVDRDCARARARERGKRISCHKQRGWHTYTSTYSFNTASRRMILDYRAYDGSFAATKRPNRKSYDRTVCNKHAMPNNYMLNIDTVNSCLHSWSNSSEVILPYN